MKLFGKFLIEKNAITKEDLVRALLIQLQRSPSIPEIVFTEKLLSTDHIFEIFQIQSSQKLGFIEAARELGCWSVNLQESVEKILNAKRPPIGEILIQLGATDIATISKCLDEFLGSIEVSEVKEKPVETHEGIDELKEMLAEIQNELSVETTIESAADAYCEKFNIDYFLEVTSILSFEQTGIFSEERLREVVDLVHSLKGTARFSQLPRTEAIITGLEDNLNKILKVGVEKVNSQLISKLELHFKKYLDLLWTLREDLAQGISEDASIDQRDLKSSYQQLTGQVF